MGRTARATGRTRRRASARRRPRCRAGSPTVRAGLIVGPHDNVFRLPWWVRRIAAGRTRPGAGRPGAARCSSSTRATSPRFMLDLAEQRVAGAFNGTGPIGQTTMGEVLDARPGDAELVWIPDEPLRGGRGRAVDGAPAVAAGRRYPGTWRVGTEQAQAAGLRCRPVAETVADVRRWLESGGETRVDDWRASTARRR